MAHYVRAICLTANRGNVLQDFGDGTEANEYTDQNLPNGITLQDVEHQATTAFSTLNGVEDLNRQVTVNENGVTVDLNADTLAELMAAEVAAAKSTLSGIENVVAKSIATPDVSETNGVVKGLTAGAPTTGSTQGAGNGNTDWNINVSEGYAIVNDDGKYHALQEDFEVHTGSELLDEGQEVYAWLVEKNVTGTVTMVVVKGTPAAIGQATAPTDNDITQSCGDYWIKVAQLYLKRTADTTLVQTEDPSFMQPWGGGASALVNEIKGFLNTADFQSLLLALRQGMFPDGSAEPPPA